MIDDAKVVAVRALSISLFDRIWPVAGLAAASIVDLAWIGFLGYGLLS